MNVPVTKYVVADELLEPLLTGVVLEELLELLLDELVPDDGCVLLGILACTVAPPVVVGCTADNVLCLLAELLAFCAAVCDCVFVCKFALVLAL